MSIEKEAFRSYTVGEPKIDSFTVRLNEEERKQLEEDKKLLEQPKDSTALKQLAQIGHNVIHSTSTGLVLAVVFKNKANNKRLGIVEFEA